MRVGLLIFLSLLLLLTPIVSACGGGAPKGAEIRIGVMGGQSAHAASSVVPLLEELEHIFRYINEVEGGIDGVKVDWRIVDNKGTPDGAVMAYKELRDTFDPLVYLSVEDYLLLGIKDMLAEDESVVFTLSTINPQGFLPPGRLFSVAIPTADGLAGFARWVLSDWKGSGKPKIGVLYWDLPSGQQWRIAEAWMRNQGVDLVPTTFPITALDLKPQLLSLRDAGVDYIWMLGLAHNAAVAIRDFRGLGLADKITFCFNEYTEANVVLDIVGPAAEGFYTYRSESPYSDGSQAAQLYSEIWKWATGEDKWTDNRILITFKAALGAAVEQAVADVGWENLDSVAVYDALNKLTEIDTWGNSEGFGYGPTKRIGVSTVKLAQFTKDGTVAVSEAVDLPRIFEGVDK
ncbi:MAG: ABC transporter substrate-binding protein [Chloroflexota bacterium]